MGTQRRPPTATPRAEAAEAGLRSTPTRLDGPTATSMQAHLGVDVATVRVHTGPDAAASAGHVGARAFTVGEHIVFGAGMFQPGTAAGRGLLAHELTHVVQQRAAGTSSGVAGFGIDPDAAAERQAQQTGDAVEHSPGTGPPGGCQGRCAHSAPVVGANSLQLAVSRGSVQRSACADASRLHAARAGRAADRTSAIATPETPQTTAESTAASTAEADAAWASAAGTIDFVISVLEHPVAQWALTTMPLPARATPQALQLLRAALPDIRQIWELVSDPVRLMTEVQAFVDEHLDGVPEQARAWLADAAFGSLRGSRHMVAITLALGDAVAELVSNWTAPFITAWNEFSNPLDVEAELADIACIQEKVQAGELSTLEAYTAVYGWLLGWINRYAVYVAIALIVGGAAIGAVGGGGLGGAGGAVGGAGVGAAPGAAGGGAGGAAAGAGVGWEISEAIGIAILAANAVHMLLQVVSAAERLSANDLAAAEDARAGRSPSEDERGSRLARDEEAYTTIAHVLLGLGIMGALILLAAFGAKFATAAVRGLSGRYPALGEWLTQQLARPGVARAVDDFQAGRRSVSGGPTRLPAPPEDVPSTGARSAAVETRLGDEPHRIQFRRGRIHLCTDCAELDRRLARILEVMPAEYSSEYSSFDAVAGIHVEVRRIQGAVAEGRLTGSTLDAQVRAVSARLRLAARDRGLRSLLTMDLEQLDRLAAEFGDSTLSSAQPRVADLADADLALSERTPYRPPGATRPPPPSASARARREWARDRLQQHVDAARARFEVEGFTPNQEVDIRTDPSAAARHRGSRIDAFAKDSVMQDPDLATVICSSDFVPEPDFIDAAIRARGDDWFDATTVASWRAHLLRYRARYGSRGTLTDTGSQVGPPSPTQAPNL